MPPPPSASQQHTLQPSSLLNHSTLLAVPVKTGNKVIPLVVNRCLPAQSAPVTRIASQAASSSCPRTPVTLTSQNRNSQQCKDKQNGNDHVYFS